MTVLTFTDPREVAAYIDRFEDRSIRPLNAYLWEDANSEEPIINRVRREELDMMVIDTKKDEIRVDAAVYVMQAFQDSDEGSTPLPIIVTHEKPAASQKPWDAKLLLGLRNKIEAQNLIKQLAAETAISFPVVE